MFKRQTPHTAASGNSQSLQKVMTLNLLSISHLAGVSKKSRLATSRNFGVVELMLLVALDKVIHEKIKWILAMGLANAASRHLKIPMEGEDIIVTLESEDGRQTSKIKPLTGFDRSILDIEEALQKNIAIMAQLLKKHNLLQEISILYPNVNECLGISWKELSFTHFRKHLVSVFINQVSPIPIRLGPDRRTLEDLTTQEPEHLPLYQQSPQSKHTPTSPIRSELDLSSKNFAVRLPQSGGTAGNNNNNNNNPTNINNTGVIKSKPSSAPSDMRGPTDSLSEKVKHMSLSSSKPGSPSNAPIGATSSSSSNIVSGPGKLQEQQQRGTRASLRNGLAGASKQQHVSRQNNGLFVNTTSNQSNNNTGTNIHNSTSAPSSSSTSASSPSPLAHVFAHSHRQDSDI